MVLKRRSSPFLVLSLLLVATAPALSISTMGAPDTRPGSDVPIPEGYRLEHHRAPTPAEVPGAVTASTDDAEALHRTGHVRFIDVMKVPRSAAPGIEGKWLVGTPHVAIPGSTWLPQAGEGELTAPLERYFRANLDRLTQGDRSAPLLFYCIADCWMSWNAAKRALSWGYTTVYWYRDGIDGWQEFSLPVETIDPVPLDADAP